MDCRIPRRRVFTYGSVACAASLPHQARPMRFALRTAPMPMNLPWHPSANTRIAALELRHKGITGRTIDD